MIQTILKTATLTDLRDAREQVAHWLHLNADEVSSVVAVAYICKHFEQGDYSSWDGWIEMRTNDAASEDRAYERALRARGERRSTGDAALMQWTARHA
jgi:hypothetical protein